MIRSAPACKRDGTLVAARRRHRDGRRRLRDAVAGGAVARRDPRRRGRTAARTCAIRARAVATNTPPNGAFRGFGAPQTQFATECHLDRIAEQLGIDPVELRRTQRRIARATSRRPARCCARASGAHEVLERTGRARRLDASVAATIETANAQAAASERKGSPDERRQARSVSPRRPPRRAAARRGIGSRSSTTAPGSPAAARTSSVGRGARPHARCAAAHARCEHRDRAGHHHHVRADRRRRARRAGRTRAGRDTGHRPGSRQRTHRGVAHLHGGRRAARAVRDADAASGSSCAAERPLAGRARLRSRGP